MRLAYLVSRFPTLSETFVIREVLEVQRLGHEVQVYSLKGGSDSGYDRAAEETVRATQYSPFLWSGPLLWANLKAAAVHPIRYWGTLGYLLFHGIRQPLECVKGLVTFPKVVYYGALMASRGVEHVHAHFANVPTLAALVIRRIWGIPYSFVGHGLHDLFDFRTMLRNKVRHARFAVLISEYNRQHVVRDCDPADAAKLHVVRTGTDVERLSRVPRQPEKGLLVTVARLSAEKGLTYMVEALSLLRQRGVRARWSVAGEGAERGALEAKVRELGLGGEVTLWGAIAAEEVAPLVARAEVFVLPSLFEGLPVTLMEAMALRVPVVSTAITGIPELVRDGRTGLLAQPRDPTGLADAIERLLKDPELAGRLAENGYRLVREEFDLRRNARRVVDLIEQSNR